MNRSARRGLSGSDSIFNRSSIMMTDNRIRSTHLSPAAACAFSRPRSGGWSRASWSCWPSSTSWIAIAPFSGSYNIRPLLHRVALFGVLAVGAAVVIIAGGIDLSTGAVVALSSVVSAKLLTEWLRTGGGSGAAAVGRHRRRWRSV